MGFEFDSCTTDILTPAESRESEPGGEAEGRMRTVSLLTFGALVPILLLPGCASKPADPPPAPAVTVAAVPDRDITEWDEFTGRFEAVEQVEIRPRVAGYIKRVAFAEGKEVK